MKPFIFDKRNGIHIIDLTKSLIMIQESVKFVEEVAKTGDSILFVGTKKQAQSVIKEVAEDSGQPYVSHRWLGGMLTNSDTIRQRVKRLKELEKMEADGTLDSMHKKEASKTRHELAKLRRNLSGVADMNKLPGAMFIVDINREAIAVKEAVLLNIPVIAIVDTNCDPTQVDFAIPGNDDSVRSITLIAQHIGEAISNGKVAAQKAREERMAAEAELEAQEAAARAEAQAKAAERAAEAVKVKAEADAKKAAEAKKTEASAPKTKDEPKAEVTKDEDKTASDKQENLGGLWVSLARLLSGGVFPKHHHPYPHCP